MLDLLGTLSPKGKYPLISMVRAGSWCEACEPYDIKDIDEWYDSDVNLLGDGFWLKVEGDSMTSPVGQSIPEGHMVLVDTGREPVNGSLVVAKLTDANEATFKKLVIDGGQKYLKGLNPSWPMTPINGELQDYRCCRRGEGQIRMIRDCGATLNTLNCQRQF